MEETEGPELGAEATAASGADPAAISIALSAATQNERVAAKAEAYLETQRRLGDLQCEVLANKEQYELSHLRFRHFSEFAKFAMVIAIGLVVLLAVCGLGTMVWNAAHDRGMVVEAFSVPPELVETGMTGSVLANRLIDRFGQLQSSSIAISQGTASYRRDSADAVRVEIPETGVSIGELDRYLRDWLGHESHVGGDLVRDAKGYSLTVRYGDRPGATVTGNDLDALLNQGAERLMAAAVPYRYIEYLARKHRVTEALAMLPSLATSGSPREQARALAAWADLYFRQGDMWDAASKAYEGLRLEPGDPVLLAWAGAAEGNLLHEEASYKAMAAVPQRLEGEAAADMAPDVVTIMPLLFQVYREELVGNFIAALTGGWPELEKRGSTAYDNGSHATDAALDHDISLARRLYEAIPAAEIQNPSQTNAVLANVVAAAFQGDWALAARRGEEGDAIVKAHPVLMSARVNYLPAWAYARAKSGDLAGARALIAATPLGCDGCLRARGKIAALAGDWAASARWFAIVSARSPDIPFADTDWGETLLHKGDLDGAMAKFESASQKGPHFADPLELWGEALMTKNRSDLALAKFAQAAQYAPNWGRLHLKWGEALVWAGKPDEAKKQFAVASGLDLTAGEKAELVRQLPHA